MLEDGIAIALFGSATSYGRTVWLKGRDVRTSGSILSAFYDHIIRPYIGRGSSDERLSDRLARFERLFPIVGT